MTHKNLISHTPGLPSCYGGYVETESPDVDRAKMVHEMNCFIREHGGDVFRAEIIEHLTPPTSDPKYNEGFVPTIGWKVYIYEPTNGEQPKGE